MTAKEAVNKITETTMLPLSIVGVILITLVGGMLWLTNIHATGMANASSIRRIEKSSADSEKKMETKRDVIIEKLNTLSTELAIIKGYLKQKEK